MEVSRLVISRRTQPEFLVRPKVLVVLRQRAVDEIEEVDSRTRREAFLPDSEADFVGQTLE